MSSKKFRKRKKYTASALAVAMTGSLMIQSGVDIVKATETDEKVVIDRNASLKEATLETTHLENLPMEEKINLKAEESPINIEASKSESDENIMRATAFRSASSNVSDEVYQSVKATLENISYNDERMLNKVAQTYFPASERNEKKKEIAKKQGRTDWYAISDNEAISELKKDSLKALPYEESFNKVKMNLENIVTRLVSEDKKRASSSNRGSDYYISKINADPVGFLLGLTYITRLYDFNMGNENIKDTLIFNPSAFGSDVDALSMIMSLGSMSNKEYSLKESANVFNKYIAGKVASNNLVDFLEKTKMKYAPDKTMSDWFKESSKAIIKETSSDEKPNVDVSIYHKLATDINLNSHLLPMLTVAENSLYVISNIASITYGSVDTYIDPALKANKDVYAQKIEEFKNTILERGAKAQKEYIDTWFRLAKQDKHEILQSNRIVVDTLKKYSDDPYATSSSLWSSRYGDNAMKAVSDFIFPLGLYSNFSQADAQAEGENLRLFFAKMLEDRGLSTYTHELTHILEEDVWLGGNETRDGFEAEFYARGLYESYEKEEPVYSLNMIYDRDKTSYFNGQPSRFQDVKDLKDYMSTLSDVIYTLDYAEAESILKKDTDAKQKWFNVLEEVVDVDTRYSKIPQPNAVHHEDKVRNITSNEAAKLTKLDDLINNNIIVSRYDVNGRLNTGLVKSNQYYTIPYFSPIYAAPQNDKGVSGDIISKKYSFDLLGEYGYYEAMVPFISNQYKAEAEAAGKLISDEFLINRISDGAYKSMAAFKKAMFDKRIAKLSELRPIEINYNGKTHKIDSFETIQRLMNEAVAKDLANPQNFRSDISRTAPIDTEVEKLKSAIFMAYKDLTNDFSTGIYEKKKVEVVGKVRGGYKEPFTINVDLDTQNPKDYLDDLLNADNFKPYVLINESEKNDMTGIESQIVDGNLKKVVFEFAKLGRLIVDGVATDFSVNTVGDRTEVFFTSPAKPKNGTLRYEDDKDYKESDYGKKIVLTGEDRFSDVVLNTYIPPAKAHDVVINYNHLGKVIKSDNLKINNAEDITPELPTAKDDKYRYEISNDFDMNQLKNIDSPKTINIPLKLVTEAETLVPPMKNVYDVTINYMFKNSQIHTQTQRVVAGEDAKLSLPVAADGRYELVDTFDSNSLKNILENKVLSVPLKLVREAGIIDPKKVSYSITINYKHDGKVLKTASLYVADGDNIELDIPRADTGVYELSTSFDKNMLKNIKESKVIDVELVHVVEALELSKADEIKKEDTTDTRVKEEKQSKTDIEKENVKEVKKIKSNRATPQTSDENLPLGGAILSIIGSILVFFRVRKEK